MQGLNEFLLLGTPHAVRLWGMVIVVSCGLLVLAFSTSYSSGRGVRKNDEFCIQK